MLHLCVFTEVLNSRKKKFIKFVEKIAESFGTHFFIGPCREGIEIIMPANQDMAHYSMCTKAHLMAQDQCLNMISLAAVLYA